MNSVGTWLKGLASALIGGMVDVVYQTVAAAAPGGKIDWKRVGLSALLLASGYIKQSPFPGGGGSLLGK